MEIEQYWTIVVAIISAAWVLVTLIRTRLEQTIGQSNALLSRQLEYNRQILEYPETQKFISKNISQSEAFFRDNVHLESDDFYRAKTLVYMQLNIFDEVLAFSSKSGKWWNIFKPPAVAELINWESYIKEILKHPFYRSVLNNEGEIFGVSLQKFWQKNKVDLSEQIPKKFLW